MKSILVTDNLFIFPEHEQQLRDAGYEITRLENPEADKQKLIEAVKGKIGYIDGGIEKVTEDVIDAATELKAFVFSGIGYKGFIPAWEHATKKGIAIANVPDGPTNAVAEWAVAAALAMNRDLFGLSRTGAKGFITTTGLEDQAIGIVALGRIGRRIAEMTKVFRPKQIIYNSAHHHEADEEKLGLKFASLPQLLAESDVIFLCLPDEVGQNFFSHKQFNQLKHGALLISILHVGILNQDALYENLKAGKIRVASDYPMDKRFDEFPLSTWYSHSITNAFNTEAGLKYTSDESVKSLLNLLSTGDDKNLVNPKYRNYRKN